MHGGVFYCTQPPPVEPKDSLEPQTERHTKNAKRTKHVRRQDHGARSLNAAIWLRDIEQGLLDWERARALNANRRSYYKVGPCDGCGSSTVSRQAMAICWTHGGREGGVPALQDALERQWLYSVQLEDFIRVA